MTSALASIVVVGASLAGLRAAEVLRQEGYDGSLTIIGAEPHLPYDRPPLSKGLLAGTLTADDIALRNADSYGSLDLDLRLGSPASSLDLDRRELVLESGEPIAFDGLVISTGTSARHLPGSPALTGIHVLRTIDDAQAIAAALDRRPQVVVIGAGFIGSEVASSAQGRGLEVTVVEAMEVPMVRAVGVTMGRVLA
ncbi:MAG: NAD(P)/FAD-dependent oxidoreductase, partial [Pseudonocardiaceae bacterium]